MAKSASPTLTFEQGLQRAAALCCASEHCIADISEKLFRWGVAKSDSERIIDTLLDEKYIDESRYALAYTRDKVRFSHWGRVKIRAMLRMQHISDNDISHAFDGIDEEEYLDILKGVIEGKRRTMGESESYASRAKLIRFALQRGFEMHEITKFISEY
ncbi:MAG: RecX family transcriptional regulator [Bacteroidaceae bacterium]|jgi:regulatory protein|nr:RecX family transcriptional regulator [Bacteroidaceae bacterium]